MRLRPATVQHTVQDVKRFLDRSGHVASYSAVSEYLKGYLGKAPKTYNGQITPLRRFVRDFLGVGGSHRILQDGSGRCTEGVQ